MDSYNDKVIVVSAPSGAGKTTIVRHLLSVFPELEFSVSATSRPMRKGEKDGREYHFIDAARFREMIDWGELLEWQEVYPGVFYGTPVSEVSRITAKGKIPVFDLDVVGGLNVKRMFGDKALALFVQPPSFEVLEKRLRERATDSEESIRKRLSKVKWELEFFKDFDQVIVNDNLRHAYARSEELVKEFVKTHE